MLTKFGLTENELTQYRQLMQLPETDENGFYDEEIDVKITHLKRLRLRRLQVQNEEKRKVDNQKTNKDN
jgi:hypothetical protein